MAITQRKRTVVNPARKNAGGRKKLSPAQIAAGFGGKRRKAAAKTKRRHKPAARTNSARRAAPKRKTVHRTAKRRTVRKNLGKIISFSLPTATKENKSVAKVKRNKAVKRNTSHRKTKMNTTKRRHSRRNPGVGDLTGLVSSAVFTIAGAVGTKYLTQAVLQSNNTGVMGYFGNLVGAFLLSWGVKSFMKNDKAAAAVLSGGIVQVVLRLIADYTPFGQYTSSLGMGDYLAQNFTTPQRIAYQTHSAALMPNTTNGMSGTLYGQGSGLYNAA